MIWVFVMTAVSMVICYQVAKARNASRRFWLIVSLLVGPLAIPFVFFSKKASV
ncbi:hypothetical protein [Paraferrimonas haliotis]|uniref:Uncharacterized protein n=1 Tax=Paraferrimonas haliotis TaxID=2013866 RepID=A0AA37TQQ3_9GAMM|nr:hypothetical protein [Paraferrimonas haliotis]GLS82891.1 hypothetical protein GCM10007894_08680 [Paraferrimonas haliotis]